MHCFNIKIDCFDLKKHLLLSCFSMEKQCVGFIVAASNFASARQQLQSSTSTGRRGKSETKVFAPLIFPGIARN